MEMTPDVKKKLTYNFTKLENFTLITVMGHEVHPTRLEFIAMKVKPIELQKDPANFGYIIVQTCSDSTKSVEDCSKEEGNFIIVVAVN